MGGMFSNLSQLLVLMDIPMKIAVDYVTDKILDELNIQMVNQRIGLNENSFYEPTGEFYSAWRNEISARVGDIVSGKVDFDPTMLSLDTDNFIHGSNYYDSGNDVRDIMPWIIFGGNSGSFFGNGFWRDSRDAWTPTMNTLTSSFNRWVKEGFMKSGISIQ